MWDAAASPWLPFCHLCLGKAQLIQDCWSRSAHNPRTNFASQVLTTAPTLACWEAPETGVFSAFGVPHTGVLFYSMENTIKLSFLKWTQCPRFASVPPSTPSSRHTSIHWGRMCDGLTKGEKN